MPQWTFRSHPTDAIPLNSIDRGYGVKHRGNGAPMARTAPENNAGNAMLTDSAGNWLALWVTEVQADFQMQGSTVQSASHRSFFARNFAMVGLVVRGQHASIYQAGRLSEFIRHSQVRALMDEPRSLTLAVLGGGVNVKRGQKGKSQPIVVQGHIETTTRGAERFTHAPEFEFTFMVHYSPPGGLFETDVFNPQVLLSWQEQFIKPGDDAYFTRKQNGFYENDPDLSKFDPLLGAANKLVEAGSGLAPRDIGGLIGGLLG